MRVFPNTHCNSYGRHNNRQILFPKNLEGCGLSKVVVHKQAETRQFEGRGYENNHQSNG